MKPHPSSGLAVIVLAAGLSSRLGRPKALATVHGLTLLCRTLRVLERLDLRHIGVIAPPGAARFAAQSRASRATLIANPNRARGLSTSVQRGLSAARHASAALILPVDLARLDPRDLARLISRWRGARRRVCGRRLSIAPLRVGAPLILPRRLFAQARRLSGDVGFRGLIANLPAEAVIAVTMPSAAADVDTPADLQAARRRFAGAWVAARAYRPLR